MYRFVKVQILQKFKFKKLQIYCLVLKNSHFLSLNSNFVQIWQKKSDLQNSYSNFKFQIWTI
jgi:hypothetical protein